MDVELSICPYCRAAAGRTKQHLITRNQARRNRNSARYRNDARFVIRACFSCNVRLGCRNRTPPGYAFKADLERITGDPYETWDGSAEGLRQVVRR